MGSPATVAVTKLPGRETWSARATSCQLSPNTARRSSSASSGLRYQSLGIVRARSSGSEASNAAIS
jgi:hypothetical protein